jgi:hypothetical protein
MGNGNFYEKFCWKVQFNEMELFETPLIWADFAQNINISLILLRR